tara:strand:+ start:670 stop:855 length:186 start_codon:yes stop_codon:yes gene_type:complete
MDIYQETSLAIDFSKGQSIDIIVVFEGVEVESKTFNNNTHQIEEVVEYIHYNENGGCDVFF